MNEKSREWPKCYLVSEEKAELPSQEITGTNPAGISINTNTGRTGRGR